MSCGKRFDPCGELVQTHDAEVRDTAHVVLAGECQALFEATVEVAEKRKNLMAAQQLKQQGETEKTAM
jgi:hypothetical protein